MAQQRIGIVGAGPAGLAALKAVMDTPQYKAGLWLPTAFEARENVGGVWLPSAPPQTHPPTGTQLPPPPPPTPLYDSLTTNLPHPVMAFTAFPFPPSTPLFPKAHVVQTYLEAYAAHFELHQHILLNTRVTKADWDIDRGKWVVITTPSSSPSSPSSSPGQSTTHTFDLLLICNGHHNLPRYPFVPGLDSWLSKGKAAHSMYYRNPSSIPTPSTTSTSATATRPLKDQTILVIGGGPSGSDITAELVPLAGRVLHSFSANSAAARASSSSSSTPQPSSPPPNSNPETLPDPLPTSSSRGAVPKPRTTWFHDDGTVQFEDGSEERGVDYCILATGYEVDFPFFTASNAPSGSTRGTLNEEVGGGGDEDEDEKLKDPNFELSIDLVPYLPPHISHLPETELINTTYGVFPLARHLFGIPGGNFSQDPKGQNAQSRPSSPSPPPSLPPPTSLAFLGLLVRVAPLPLVEVQARAALAAFAVGSSPSSSSSSSSPSSSPESSAVESVIDWHLEETRILKRWQDLRAKFEGASAPSSSSTNSFPPPAHTSTTPTPPPAPPCPSPSHTNAPQPSHTHTPTPIPASASTPAFTSPPAPPSLSAELDLRTFISKEWHKLSEDGEQFDYRDELDEFAFSLLSSSSSSPSPVSPLASSPASPSLPTPTSPANPQAPTGPSPLPSTHTRVKVKPWERHFYTHRPTLRKAWRELEARGWAEEWVKGVGSGELDIPRSFELGVGVGVELPGEGEDGDDGGVGGGGEKKQTREERAEAEWVWFMGKVLEFGRGL